MQLNAKKLMLLIFLCLVGWQAFVWDGYLQKVDVAYAAWRQPNQSGSDWSNIFFVSRYPPLFSFVFGSLFSLKMANANFNNANFLNGGINDTHFENTKFVNTNMKKSYFRKCTFKRCDLRNADLKDAHLENTLFRDTDFRGANLSGANLRGATFWNVDLRGANLTEANIVLNWFYRSDLRGANLNWGKTGAVLYDSQTKWPKGFNLNNDMFMLIDTPPELGGR